MKEKMKIKVMSPWEFFKIMITSAIICKQRLLHEKQIEQLLHNYKCYDVNQSRFWRLLKSSAKNVKNNYPKRIPSFLPAFQFVTSLSV